MYLDTNSKKVSVSYLDTIFKVSLPSLVLSIRGESGRFSRFTCPHNKGMRTTKNYTTALPNTDIYDMNKSTNKCTSVVVQGRPKTMYQYTLSIFPAKKGKKTEKCQRGQKTANICQDLLFRCRICFLLIHNSQLCRVIELGKSNYTGREWGKMGQKSSKKGRN